MSSISFKNNGINAYLKNTRYLKKLILFIFNNEGFEFDRIIIIFSTDEAVLELNRQFLNHNTLTDILTFTMSSENQPLSSEIYISVERVRENAEKFEVTYINELYRVIIHGILHLCGFSDHTRKLKAAMREKENFYLAKVSFT
ncbi:MAG: rRNA maturation RNase YbeY [Bacteroidota bacterium]|nr:rRNA maturation RNase YbeY [Bacteroidota bacterium]